MEQYRIEYQFDTSGSTKGQWRNWNHKRYKSIRRALQAIDAIRISNGNAGKVYWNNIFEYDYCLHFRIVHYYGH